MPQIREMYLNMSEIEIINNALTLQASLEEEPSDALIQLSASMDQFVDSARQYKPERKDGNVEVCVSLY